MSKILFTACALVFSSMALANCNVHVHEHKIKLYKGMITDEVRREMKTDGQNAKRTGMLISTLEKKGYSVVGDEREATIRARFDLGEGIGLMKQLSGSYHGFHVNNFTTLTITDGVNYFNKEVSGHSLTGFKTLLNQVPVCVK